MCGFFKKFQNTNEPACKGFIAQYCKGEMQSQCKRKEYRKKNGTPPVDEMMPNGMFIKS